MKKLLIIALFLASFASISAQKAADFFKTMPTEVMPLLKQNDKLDLLDYYAAQGTAKVKNVFGYEVVMLKLTDDELLLKTSEVSTLQLRVVRNGNQISLEMTNTLTSNGITNTIVKHFTSDWKPMG